MQSEIIWSGRMLDGSDLRLDITYWEDDGGWSGVDGGNMYYLDENLANLGDGRIDYAGTSLPDYDAYVYVEKFSETPGTDNPMGELEAQLDPQSLVPDGLDDPPGLDLVPAPRLAVVVS